MIDRPVLMELYQQACEIELQAFKPGNVSVFSDGHDMTVADFRISAKVSAAPLTEPTYCLGEKIYHAVKATQDAVGCNTNLGIILLCAPLIQAVASGKQRQSLRQALLEVLQNTTREDADWVFKAISLASPGGLGKVDQQDVGQSASVTLTQAMNLAAERDRIAMQYANCFKDIFDFTVLKYNCAFVLSGDSGLSGLTVFAELLARYPDSHIERKYGEQFSDWVAEQMVLLCKALDGAESQLEVLPMLYRMDKDFKAKKINPGTSADMTVATVLVVFLEQFFSQVIE